jgi:hypothetical protein
MKSNMAVSHWINFRMIFQIDIIDKYDIYDP